MENEWKVFSLEPIIILPIFSALGPPSEAGVARKMLHCIPDKARDIIMKGDFKGADLVTLASEVHRPSFKAICGEGLIL